MPQLPSLTPEMLVPRLGDFLVENGYIHKDKLAQALEQQQALKNQGQIILLGKILVDMGFIDQNVLDQAVTEQILRLRNALQDANQQLEKRVQQRTAELQEALNKITELSRLKTNFISNISHELRTPLTHIKGYLELLAAEDLGNINEDQKQAVGTMVNSSNRLEKLIDDLIMFSNMDRGTTAINVRSFDIKSICIETISRTQAKARERGVLLDFKCPDETTHIIADQQKVSWVILELLENAVKFTDQGGQVTLGFVPEEYKVRVFVRDTGIGIPKEKLDEIFLPFHQLDSSATRKYSGTGLGLTLAREIIEAHESKIEVKSMVGKGTEFSFILKAAK
jgi:signal transduction histidine kinase